MTIRPTQAHRAQSLYTSFSYTLYMRWTTLLVPLIKEGWKDYLSSKNLFPEPIEV
jgi:hypothetical protein